MARENIVCIFAHPDDEAFGPSGIIAKWAEKYNVYLICITDGSNPKSGISKLSSIRKKELQRSSKILGVKKVYFLGYTDGELRNNIYHKVCKNIQKILQKLKPKTLLTYEMKGVSGHIDHIFVSMVTSYLYQNLKFVKKIYYFAENKIVSKLMKNYFIYFPEGYSKKQVDHVEDIKGVIDKKIEAVKAHRSQKKDARLILAKLKFLPKEEYFFVKEKEVSKKLSQLSKNTIKEIRNLLQHSK